MDIDDMPAMLHVTDGKIHSIFVLLSVMKRLARITFPQFAKVSTFLSVPELSLLLCDGFTCAFYPFFEIEFALQKTL
jgi:hypothetical protein